jgi:hypothetical protein
MRDGPHKTARWYSEPPRGKRRSWPRIPPVAPAPGGWSAAPSTPAGPGHHRRAPGVFSLSPRNESMIPWGGPGPFPPLAQGFGYGSGAEGMTVAEEND